jgi:non-canonical poly(A) RNA polymerase PAPD5/7
LLPRYKKLGVRKLAMIKSARIPIIKLTTGNSVTVDISLGDGSGPRAASYISQQVEAYPPLAPLVLVLKVFLRSLGLNEVANGGLSSFSLTNMVLAHLQEELKLGADIYDLGETLYSFLCRYGDEFDYDGEAVSVASGGIVSRAALSAGWGTGATLGDPRILVDDPLTGECGVVISEG